MGVARPGARLGVARRCSSLGQVLAGLYLALAIAPNHKGMPTWTAGQPATFLERQVLSSRNIVPHPVTDFVFGGLNYQIEHHLFPTMPRVHLRRARAIVEPYCGSVDWRTSRWARSRRTGWLSRNLRRVSRMAAAQWD